MAQSFPDIPLNNGWQDIVVVAGYATIASQKVTLQSKIGGAAVYFGGNAAPSGNSGIILNPGQSVTGTADHFWVRGSGTIAVLVED